MLLCIDIGNTNITLGVYDNNTILETFRLHSDKDLGQKEYELLISTITKPYKIKKCIIGSVVEELNEKILKACNKIFEIESFLFSSSSKQGLNISLKNPKEVGADRIANAYCAKIKYKLPAIVIDIGTATTFDVVSKDGSFLGGVIMPGLNLQFKSESQDLTYENIVLANDSDSDGGRIAGLYIGFFMKYFNSIIKDGKLKRLKTPVIALKDKKENIKHFFFTLNEYNEFIKTNDISSLKIHYYKGLGSWEPKDLQPLISKYGLDYFLETFILDNNAVETVDNWLNSKNSDKRKEYLNNNTFSIFKI